MTSEGSQLIVGPWTVDAPTYHADRLCVSQGWLKTLREKPAEFHGRFNLGMPSKPPSREMRVGTIMHTLVLERELLVAGNPHRKGTKASDEFCTLNEGALVVPEDELTEARWMADAICEHPDVGPLLDQQFLAEHIIRWRDLATDVWCRAMRDMVIMRPDEPEDWILDLKSCADNSKPVFERQIENLFYHCQAAHYVQGHYEVYGRAARFIFVTADRNPWSRAACYQLREDHLKAGARLNQAALVELADRRKRNDWTPDYGRGIVMIDRPPWAKRNDNHFYEGDSNG